MRVDSLWEATRTLEQPQGARAGALDAGDALIAHRSWPPGAALERVAAARAARHARRPCPARARAFAGFISLLGPCLDLAREVLLVLLPALHPAAFLPHATLAHRAAVASACLSKLLGAQRAPTSLSILPLIASTALQSAILLLQQVTGICGGAAHAGRHRTRAHQHLAGAFRDKRKQPPAFTHARAG